MFKVLNIKERNHTYTMLYLTSQDVAIHSSGVVFLYGYGNSEQPES